MKETIKIRLHELEQEYQKGQNQLKNLETEATNIRTALLRISGAIQVLKETLEANEEQEVALTSKEESQ